MPTDAIDNLSRACDMPGFIQAVWRRTRRTIEAAIPLSLDAGTGELLYAYARNALANRMVELAQAAAVKAIDAPADERLACALGAIDGGLPRITPVALRLRAARIAAESVMRMLRRARFASPARTFARLQYMHAPSATGLFAPNFYLRQGESADPTALVVEQIPAASIVAAWQAQGFHPLRRDDAAIPLTQIPRLLGATARFLLAWRKVARRSTLAGLLALEALLDADRTGVFALAATTRSRHWIGYYSYDIRLVAAAAWARFLDYRFTAYMYAVSSPSTGRVVEAYIPNDILLTWSDESLGHFAGTVRARELRATGCWMGESGDQAEAWPGPAGANRILFFDNAYIPGVALSTAAQQIGFLNAVLALAERPGASIVVKTKHRDAERITERFPPSVRRQAAELWDRIKSHPSIALHTRLDSDPFDLCRAAQAVGVMDFMTAGFVSLFAGAPTRFLCETVPSDEDFPYVASYQRIIDTDWTAYAEHLWADTLSGPAACGEIASARAMFGANDPGAGMHKLRAELGLTDTAHRTPRGERPGTLAA